MKRFMQIMLFIKSISIVSLPLFLFACTGESDNLPGPYEKTIMEMKLRDRPGHVPKERSLYSTFYIPRNHYVFAYFKRDYQEKVGAAFLSVYFMYPDGSGLTKETSKIAQNFVVPNKWVKVFILPKNTFMDIKARFRLSMEHTPLAFKKIKVNKGNGIDVYRSTKRREESIYAFTDYKNTFVYVNCGDFSVSPVCRAEKTYRNHEVEYRFYAKDMVEHLRDINKKVNELFDSFKPVLNVKK